VVRYAVVYSPQGRYDALETGKQHGRSKMNGLIRMLEVALGCLARAKEREPSTLELLLHDLRHTQITRAQAEAALVRLDHVLNTMACEMHEIGRLEACQDIGRGTPSGIEIDRHACALGRLSDILSLGLDVSKGGHAQVLGVLGSGDEKLDVLGSDYAIALLRPHECTQCGRIRRNEIVRATVLVGTFIDPRCMDRHKCKSTGAAPMNPRSRMATSFLEIFCENADIARTHQISLEYRDA
jgi:hypothetical protein